MNGLIEPHEALQQWLRFLTSEAHTLRHEPDLLFQLAANQPDSSCLATLASVATSRGAVRRPWLRRINKPQRLAPRLVTLVLAQGTTPRYLPEPGRSSFSLHPDGIHVATTVTEGPIQIWDAASGRDVGSFADGALAATSVAWSPAGDRIAAGIVPRDRPGAAELSVWSIDGRDLLRLASDRLVTVYGFSPSGTHIAVGYTVPRNSMFEGVEEVAILNAQDGSVVFHRRGGAKGRGLLTCAYSRDGLRLMLAWRSGLGEILDGTSGAVLGEVPVPSRTPALAFSPDGQRMAYADGQRGETLRIASIDGGSPVVIGPVPGRMWCCSFSPDGRELATSSDSALARWNTQTGALLARVAEPAAIRCAYSADGRRLATSTERAVTIWSSDLGNHVEPIGEEGASISDIAFSLDGRTIAWTKAFDDPGPHPSGLTHRRKQVRIVNADTGLETPLQFDGARPRFLPDGSRFAIVAADQLIVCSALTGEPLLRFQQHALHDFSFSPDGTRVVTVGTVFPCLQVWDTSTGRAIAELEDPKGYEVAAATFSPDGRWLVSASKGKDRRIRLWDPTDGSPITVLLEGWQDTLQWLPDGQRFLARTGDTLKIVDIRSRARLDTGLRSHTVVIDPAGQWIAAGGGRVTGNTWTRSPRLTIADLRNVPASEVVVDAEGGEPVAAASTGRWFAAWWGGRLRLWDAEGRRELCRCQVGSSHVSLSPLARRLAVDGGLADLQLVELEGVAPGIPVVTGAYLFRLDRRRWDEEPSARCPQCVRRFAVPTAVTAAIDDWHHTTAPSDIDNWYACLPPAAWTDTRLTAPCGNCGQLVRFNPWTIDGRQDDRSVSTLTTLVRSTVRRFLKARRSTRAD